MPFNIRTPLWMRFAELRWSPPRKVISEGVAVSAPFELRNISEKKFPFFEKGRRKEGLGGGGAVSILLIFFSYGEKVNYLIHGIVGGGGAGALGRLVAI